MQTQCFFFCNCSLDRISSANPRRLLYVELTPRESNVFRPQSRRRHVNTRNTEEASRLAQIVESPTPRSNARTFGRDCRDAWRWAVHLQPPNGTPLIRKARSSAAGECVSCFPYPPMLRGRDIAQTGARCLDAYVRRCPTAPLPAYAFLNALERLFSLSKRLHSLRETQTRK